MEVTASIEKESKTNLWGGGTSPVKASYGKIMMWFFLLSDAFTFSGLLITYGFLRYSYPAFAGPVSAFKPSVDYWPIPEKIFDAVPFLHGVHLPLLFVGIMTFILILSSVTMVLAVEAGQRMDRKDVTKWMLWTIVGGLAFLAGRGGFVEAHTVLVVLFAAVMGFMLMNYRFAWREPREGWGPLEMKI